MKKWHQISASFPIVLIITKTSSNTQFYQMICAGIVFYSDSYFPDSFFPNNGVATLFAKYLKVRIRCKHISGL